MKVCLNCDTAYSAATWKCSSCGAVPEIISGFPAFSPGLARSNDGFQADAFNLLYNIEGKNFWFKGRNKLLLSVFRRFFAQAGSFLEIGCGTGFVLSAVEKEFPTLEVWGSEIFSTGLEFAAKRVKTRNLLQMDARRIPFEEEFDVIGAFDVLEHINEDDEVLRQMHRAVKQGGGIILTVPQHQFLWGPADEHACHVRRYGRKDLVAKVKQAGFAPVFVSSFVSLLFPFMVISRLLRKKTAMHSDKTNAELTIGEPVNTLLEKVLDLEHFFIRFGFRFPFGGSLLIAARKHKET